MINLRECSRETLCYVDINILKHTYNNFLKYIMILGALFFFYPNLEVFFLMWNLDSYGRLKVNFCLVCAENK